jgi:plastocyanin domain-containing protein
MKIKKETPLAIETIGVYYIFKDNFKKEYIEIVELFKRIDSFEEIL